MVDVQQENIDQIDGPLCFTPSKLPNPNPVIWVGPLYVKDFGVL